MTDECPIFDCADSEGNQINYTDVCDGYCDCYSCADENTCGCECKYPCGKYCFPETWICDGVDDCDDGSDEYGCATCKDYEFRCDDKKQCVLVTVTCDGDPDCADKSDEDRCDYNTCKEDDFRCANGEMCIPGVYVCDALGYEDCTDGSDQSNTTCLLRESGSIPIEQPSVSKNKQGRLSDHVEHTKGRRAGEKLLKRKMENNQQSFSKKVAKKGGLKKHWRK